MNELSLNDISYIRKLVKLKREKPEEYKQFFQDMKEIMIDLIKIAKEISEEEI